MIRRLIDTRNVSEDEKLICFDLDSSIEIRQNDGTIIGYITKIGNVICDIANSKTRTNTDGRYYVKTEFYTSIHFCESLDKLEEKIKELKKELDVWENDEPRCNDIATQIKVIQEIIDDVRWSMA